MRTLMASSVRRRGRPGAAPGCHLVPVRRRWPHSLGHRCRDWCHATPHSPSALPLAQPLSRVSNGRGAIAIAAESFASSSRPRLRVASPLRASPGPPRAPPSSPPLGCPRFHQGEPHFLGFPASGSRPSRPNSGETHRCSLPTSFLRSELR